MAIVFFQIGLVDYTAAVDIQNHSVNSQDVYETWTDGNYVEHREIVRTRITGETRLGFSDATDLADFLDDLADERDANGFYPITVFVNNLGTSEAVDAFLDQTGEAKWDIINGRRWLVLTLKIRGR